MNATRKYKIPSPLTTILKDVGLNPKEYTLILEDVELGNCKCGESIVIQEMETLHLRIAVALVADDRQLRPTGLQFMRRLLGMTPNAFAKLIPPTDPIEINL